jgi:hypothetical protein
MRHLVLATILITPFGASLQAQQGCTLTSLTQSGWSNLPSGIAFLEAQGTSLGDVQTAMSPWRNACSASLPRIYYGGSPDDYAFSGTELWTIHKGTAEEIGMVNPPRLACAEADFSEKKIRIATDSGP